eukprot:CAMPEP_0185831810 /NCGR_PEP_ID=MMETSP1353-20130828/1720_1 /TAXON_ID=1077150 /ORGANISM="Erythrolobus australicus, Strain CCMP3124" /LENGTH=60 /DNA_ID=CAMNT_0028529919 /DNA_START=16 /DNA_END=194 /DNA_ORIENTATION=-
MPLEYQLPVGFAQFRIGRVRGHAKHAMRIHRSSPAHARARARARVRARVRAVISFRLRAP